MTIKAQKRIRMNDEVFLKGEDHQVMGVVQKVTRNYVYVTNTATGEREEWPKKHTRKVLKRKKVAKGKAPSIEPRAQRKRQEKFEETHGNDFSDVSNLLDIPEFLRRDAKNQTWDNKSIHIKAQVGGVVRRVSGRAFTNPKEANKYLRTFIPNFRTSINAMSKTGGLAQLKDGRTIWANMPLKDILDGKKIPKRGLRPILDRADLQVLVMPEEKQQTVVDDTGNEVPIAPTPAKKKKARINGDVIVLKTLCQELEIDPRKARMTLRKAIKSNKILAADREHNARWEWPARSEVVEEVKKVISEVK